jgi:hypothetical protein
MRDVASITTLRALSLRRCTLRNEQYSWKGGERNCAGQGSYCHRKGFRKKKGLGQAANRTPDRSHAKGELYLGHGQRRGITGVSTYH